MNSTSDLMPQAVRGFLLKAGCVLTEDFQERLSQYASLVQEWNDYASLVSKSDLARLSDTHFHDALSLAPVILMLGQDKGLLLDIGSGGGFPAIPLGLILPDLQIVLIERSEKKVAFLRKAAAALGLGRVTIAEGGFPGAAHGFHPSLITARAVDAPGRLMHQILSFLPKGALFLCQVPESKLNIPETFHVEHVKDEWTTQGLRRGDLYIISHSTYSSSNQTTEP